MAWPLLQILWQVTSDVDGRSWEAATRTRSALDRALAKVREQCGRAPVEIRTLRSDVHAATEVPLGASGVRALEKAFARWGSAIEADTSPLSGASAALRHCERFGERVRPGYALWWDHAPDGRRWWVQVEIENRTDTRYWVDLSGTMAVTGLTHPRVGGPRDEHGGRRISWGGSSADSMYAWPSTTSTRKVGLTEFVFTTPAGLVYDVRPEVFIRHDEVTCSMPVPRLNP